MNNDILNEIDSLIDYIKNSEDYKEYIYLKDKLSKNAKAKKLINNIKKNQKLLVHKQINNEDISELDNIINSDLEELNRIPLYKDFIDKQEYLNNIFQKIRNELNEYFYEKMN